MAGYHLQHLGNKRKRLQLILDLNSDVGYETLRIFLLKRRYQV